MQHFNSLGSFAAHLLVLAAHQHKSEKNALERAAKAIEATAKSKFGTYQPDASPFPAWPTLAPSTQKDRVARGFTPDEPLLRNGKLRKSISHQVSGSTAVVGSTSEVMVAQELGTARIPPRAVLGPAAVRNKKLIQQIVGHAFLEGLLPPGHSAANYSHKV